MRRRCQLSVGRPTFNSGNSLRHLACGCLPSRCRHPSARRLSDRRSAYSHLKLMATLLTPQPISRRVLNRDGGHNILRSGMPFLLGDLYHHLLAISWPQLLVFLLFLYLTGNAVFALGYLAGGDVIENARPGSFADAFFFSV